MTRVWLLTFVTTLVLGAASRVEAQAIQALGVFEQRCGTCHTKPAADSRAPHRNSLRQRTPESILATVNGVAAKGGSLNGPGPVVSRSWGSVEDHMARSIKRGGCCNVASEVPDAPRP
jgi:mono/diheme cytochrome c family protein